MAVPNDVCLRQPSSSTTLHTYLIIPNSYYFACGLADHRGIKFTLLPFVLILCLGPLEASVPDMLSQYCRQILHLSSRSTGPQGGTRCSRTPSLIGLMSRRHPPRYMNSVPFVYRLKIRSLRLSAISRSIMREMIKGGV